MKLLGHCHISGFLERYSFPRTVGVCKELRDDAITINSITFSTQCLDGHDVAISRVQVSDNLQNGV